MAAEEETAMRILYGLSVVMLATSSLSVVAAYAQTKSPSACGVETWSTAQMAYVTVPCAGGQEQNSQTANTPAASKCGPESWSTEKMAYVGTPCPAATTYENPAGASK